VQLATNQSAVADFIIPVVTDARTARPVQNLLMHSGTLWNGIVYFLVMHITQNERHSRSFPCAARKRNTPLYQQLEPELQLIDAGK
jgi:hypothetical protein